MGGNVAFIAVDSLFLKDILNTLKHLETICELYSLILTWLNISLPIFETFNVNHFQWLWLIVLLQELKIPVNRKEATLLELFIEWSCLAGVKWTAKTFLAQTDRAQLQSAGHILNKLDDEWWKLCLIR